MNLTLETNEKHHHQPASRVLQGLGKNRRWELAHQAHQAPCCSSCVPWSLVHELLARSVTQAIAGNADGAVVEHLGANRTPIGALDARRSRRAGPERRRVAVRERTPAPSLQLGKRQLLREVINHVLPVLWWHAGKLARGSDGRRVDPRHGGNLRLHRGRHGVEISSRDGGRQGEREKQDGGRGNHGDSSEVGVGFVVKATFCTV